MEDKLKILTEKLLKEGVEKGELEAREIVQKARAESEKIVREANENAQKIMDKATSDASEKKRKTEAELRLAAIQSVSLLKNQIASLISDKISAESVKKTFEDKDFVQKMILTFLQSWIKDGGQVSDIKLYLPKVDKADLASFIKKNFKDYMKKGIELEVSDKLKSGFKVGPKDSSYMVEFSDESFKSFFKEFLKPTIRELIFN